MASTDRIKTNKNMGRPNLKLEVLENSLKLHNNEYFFKVGIIT